MPNRLSNVSRLLIVVVFGLSTTSPLHAGIIDTFTATEGGNPDEVVTIGAAFGTAVEFAISPTVADPIGSSRRLSVDQFSQSPEFAKLTVDGGTAFFASSTNATSNWTIIYGTNNVAGLHYDATAGGATAFRLTFNNISGNLEYVIRAFGYAGSGTSNFGTFQAVTSVVDVPFSSFSNSGGLVFNDLNQIRIDVRDAGLSHGGSARLDQFETIGVPEPNSMFLGGAAVVGLLAVARKRRRHQQATM